MDVQEELIEVLITESNTLDDFDLVVHPLQKGRADLVLTMSQDPIKVRLETLGMVLHGLDPSSYGPTVPTVKPLHCWTDVGVASKMAQLLLRHVRDEQPPVQLECLIQSPPILAPYVSPMRVQQIHQPLDCLSLLSCYLRILLATDRIDYSLEPLFNMKAVIDNRRIHLATQACAVNGVAGGSVRRGRFVPPCCWQGSAWSDEQG